LASESSATVARQIAVLFGAGTAAGVTDGHLLERFRTAAGAEAESAFAVLVERHGAMVLHVCAGMLGHRQDAEDAAQAVFLVLARQAGAIRRTDSIASWLYRVAVRVSARARFDAGRRRRHERRHAEERMAIDHVACGDRGGAEAWPELYQELDRLPERFLRPVVLCHLEGLSYEQAAQRLGCPVRTVQSRLSRGRARLRERLARRGVAPAVALIAAALTPTAASASPSSAWIRTTTTLAVGSATGHAVATLLPTVTFLAEGVSHTMTLQRCLRRAATLLLVGLSAAGAGIGLLAASAHPDPRPGLAPADADNPYRVTLAGGPTVEVVAVTRIPSGPKTWWRPDGTPLAKPFTDALPAHFEAGDQTVCAVLVRVTGVGEDQTLRWLPNHNGQYLGGRPTRDGKTVPGLEFYTASFRRDRTTCDVNVQVAAGTWKTLASDAGRGGHGFVQSGHKFDWGKARPYPAYGREGTSIAVAHNVIGQDRRLVAIGHDGKIHPAAYSSGLSGDTLCILDAEFLVPPDQIKEYQFQSRPFEHAVIPRISLRPATGPNKERAPE
jgi:RNA polymerase sigma factor (sigma-70 family)